MLTDNPVELLEWAPLSLYGLHRKLGQCLARLFYYGDDAIGFLVRNVVSILGLYQFPQRLRYTENLTEIRFFFGFGKHMHSSTCKIIFHCNWI